MQWYQKKTEELFVFFETSVAGLSEKVAKEKSSALGFNELPPPKKKTILSIFFGQFLSPLIYILLICAGAVLLMGEVVDAFVIISVLFLNAIVGSIQEGRAENTLSALRNFIRTEAVVRRENREIVIEDRLLVPGDIIILRDGDRVPADARLLHVSLLSVEESALTGESEPVNKTTDPLSGDLLIADQKNMVFRGTLILGGSGEAVVVGTGLNTEIGRISKTLSGIDTDLPLKENIKNLSHIIIYAVLVLSTGLFGLGVWRGIPIEEMFATVVALSVSVVPEGLPVVVTVILAAGVYRMGKAQALIKRLAAVEALGQTSILAVDKTGTVTKNQMMVRKIYIDGEYISVSGSGYEPTGVFTKKEDVLEVPDYPELLFLGKVAGLISAATLLYNEEEKAWHRRSGDPTEAALVVLSEKTGYTHEELLREYTKEAEIPFSSKTKYHASFFKKENEYVLAVAGAPDALVPYISYVARKSSLVSFDEKEEAEVFKAVTTMSSEGLRVLAILSGNEDMERIREGVLPSLTLLGLVGIVDAIRPEVKGAVEGAERAGVKVVMITGDHEETARTVAREVGIFHPGDHVLSGREIDTLSEEEFKERLPKISVFARVSPEHKLRIIDSYRKGGISVAMTGDGVNDALSLATADLGISMGRIGTEVAKEASDIVLLNDDLHSIVEAIEEGRNIYQTIRKVIFYLFSTSLGEVLVIAGAIALGLSSPLSPSQIIWLNLVTDGLLVVALAMEPKEKGLSALNKKGNAFFIDRFLFMRLMLAGALMAFGTLAVFIAYRGEDPLYVSTITLTVLAAFQWFNVWNARSDKRSIFSSDIFKNRALIIATFFTVSLHLLALYTAPVQYVLKTTPLLLFDWLFVLVIASSVIFLEEGRKFFLRLFEKKNTIRA